MNRRVFIKFGVTGSLLAAAAIAEAEGHLISSFGDYLSKQFQGLGVTGTSSSTIYTPSSATTLSNVTESEYSSLVSQTSLNRYDLTLTIFQDLHGDGKQQNDEPRLTGLEIELVEATGRSYYKPDKDGYYKLPDLSTGVDYSVRPPNSLFRYVTPSNSDLSPIPDFKFRIHPDNLELDLPVTVGPYTWPFNDDDRVVYAYMDDGHWHDGSTKMRDWMGGTKTWATHLGTDIVRPKNTRVLGSAPGSVLETVTDWPKQKPGRYATEWAGNYVVMDNGFGLISSATHLSSVLVKPDDFVKRGQPVGIIGTTGYSLGILEDNFMMRENGHFEDQYKDKIKPGYLSYWTKDSNPQRVTDPQRPLPD